MNRFKSPVLAAVASAALTAGVVGGVAMAQTNTPAVITACVAENSGNVRIVDNASACKPNESSTFWHQQGPQGEQGEQGPQGESLARLDQLAGLACTTVAGEGTTHVSVSESLAHTGDGFWSYGVTTTCKVPWPADGTPCDDGDAGTEGDIYRNGQCQGQTETTVCEDGDPYTVGQREVNGTGCVQTSVPQDEDGDGFTAGEAVGGSPDCDDTDPAIHPDAVEVVNGVDDNCNDTIDET